MVNIAAALLKRKQLGSSLRNIVPKWIKSEDLIMGTVTSGS